MVIDDGSDFKEILKNMCEFLNISIHLLAKRNTKGLSVECFHRLLNRMKKNESVDRENQQSNFIAVAVTTIFAQNSAAIDNNDVIRSIVPICRPLSFPLGIKLVKIPTSTSVPATDVAQYLRLVSNDHLFAKKMLKIMLDKRRENYRD